MRLVRHIRSRMAGARGRAKFSAAAATMCVALIAGLAMAAHPAVASQVNCTTSRAVCFGTSVSGPLSFVLSTPDWTASGTSQAYVSGSTYSYVYDLSTYTPTRSAISLSQITTASSGGFDRFNSSLNWGVLTFETTSPATPTFTFGPSSFIVSATNLVPSGDSFSFYAQSLLPPGSGTISAENGGQSNFAPAIDPAPEPGSLLLLGLALPVVGETIRRRIRG